MELELTVDLPALVSAHEIPTTIPTRIIPAGEGTTPGVQEGYWMRGDAVELACAFVALLAAISGCPPVYDLGHLWMYLPARGLWSPLTEDALRAAVGVWAGSSVYAGEDKESGNVKVRPLAMNDPGRIVKQVISEVASKPHYGPGFFDQAPEGCVFADGFVTVEQRELVFRPHSHGHRARWGYDFAWQGGAHGELVAFGRYCAGAWGDEAAERGRLVGAFMGAVLLGQAPKLNRALVLVGVAGSGKSTLLEHMERCLPGGAVAHVQPQDLSHEFKPSALIGARLNTVRECDDAPIFGEAIVRQVIGGEPMTVNVKYGQPVTFRPRAGHVFAANRLPQAPGVHAAFWRRFMVLDFKRSFRGTADDDLALIDKLQAEREGFVRWAIACAVPDIAAGDYAMPPSVRAQLDVWRIEADSVASWVEEAAQVLAADVPRDAWAEVSTVYEAYREWSQRCGLVAVSLRVFVQRLDQVPSVRRDKHPTTRRAIVNVQI